MIFLTDKATLSRLVGSLATDFVKVGIATGASIGAATIMGGFALAIGPIFAVVVVGVVVTASLDALDKRYGITDRLVAGLDELGDDAKTYIEGQKKDLKNVANKVADSIIDYAIESAQRIVVQLANRYLRKFLQSSPSIY